MTHIVATMLFRPVAVRAGVIAGLFAGAIYGAQAGTSGIDELFPSDADLFLRVGGDPFGDGSAIDAPELYGDAYRYGRILFPLAAWGLALGRVAWVQWTLLALSAVGLAVAVACAVELLAGRGVPYERMVWLLATPALWMGLRGAFSEWFALGLLLLGFVLEIDGRRRTAAVVFVLVLLTREVLLLALLPVLGRDVRTRGAKGLQRWLLIGVVPFVWHLWVWARVGELPALDGSLSRREAVDLPVAGLVDAFNELGADGALMIIAALGLGTVVAALYIGLKEPWHPIAYAGVLVALSILFFGPNVWRFPGEGLRTMMHAQVLVAIALIAHLEVRRKRARVYERSSDA